MANPFDDPDFGKAANKPRGNVFDDPNYGGASVGPGPSGTDRTLSYIDNLIRQAASGGTMGLSDELASVMDYGTRKALGATVTGGFEPGPDYTETLRRNRQQDAAFRSENPIAATAAQVAGGLATLPVTMPAQVATWLGRGGLAARALKGAAAGAGYGGAAGFAGGEGGLENRLLSAGVGAGGGAVIGGALPVAASTAGFIGRGIRESRAGQWVGANVAAPAYEKAAGVVEALAPRVRPGSLSAAAPEGGQPIIGDSAAASVAEALRRRAAVVRNTAAKGAQERLAREFERYGLDPQAVARELQRVGDGALLVNAGGTGLARTARTAYDAPGPAAQIVDDALTTQRAGAPTRLQRAFEGNEPPPTITDARRFLELNKGRVGGDVYPPAWEAGLGWTGGMGPRTPEINRLLQNPAVREAFDQITADAAKYGRELTPLEVAHMVKRQLNANTDAAFASGRAINKDMVRGLADRWERALWDANPKLADADRAYAQAAQLPDLLEQGRQFLRTGTTEMADSVSPSALAATLPQLDDTGRLAFRVGATNTARDVALSGPGPTRRLAGNIDENVLLQEKLAQIYGPERAADIIRQAGAERSMLRTDAAIRGGPNTASKLAHLVDDGLQLPNPAALASPSNLTARLWDAGTNWMRQQNAGNEPVRAEIARILMERNPTANLQNLDVIEALMLQRLNAAARASRAGAAAAGVSGNQLGGAF